MNNVLFILYHIHAIAKQHFSFSSTYISNRVYKFEDIIRVICLIYLKLKEVSAGE